LETSFVSYIHKNYHENVWIKKKTYTSYTMKWKWFHSKATKLQTVKLTANSACYQCIMKEPQRCKRYRKSCENIIMLLKDKKKLLAWWH